VFVASVGDDLTHNRLIQAAFRDQPPPLPVNFFQQNFPGRIDKAHAAKINVEFLARRRRVQFPPALLQCPYPWTCQPALYG
jgi:hypothetical protein